MKITQTCYRSEIRSLGQCCLCGKLDILISVYMARIHPFVMEQWSLTGRWMT